MKQSSHLRSVVILVTSLMCFQASGQEKKYDFEEPDKWNNTSPEQWDITSEKSFTGNNSLKFSAFGSYAPTNFFLEESNIKNVITATVKGAEVLYTSSLSTGVNCYSLDGDLIWSDSIDDRAVIYEIVAKDLDGDSHDDLLAACADGNIYCWSSNGELLWKFNPGHKVLFTEVAVTENNKLISIFAGGNNFKLYELNTRGKLVSTTPISDFVRKIESGNFKSKEREDIIVMSMVHDKSRWKDISIINGVTKQLIQKHGFNYEEIDQFTTVTMITDVLIADINKDGLDDILCFGDSKGAFFFAIDNNNHQIAEYTHGQEYQRYAHCKGACLLPYKDEIIFQSGSIMFRVDLTGKLIEKKGERYTGFCFSDLALAPKNKLLIGGGDADGGNGIYFYDFTKPNYLDLKQDAIGTLSDLRENMNTLYDQVLSFEMPAYQTPSDKEWVMITTIEPDPRINTLNGNKIKFITSEGVSESTDRSDLAAAMGLDEIPKDGRSSYSQSREDIVNIARSYEAKGQAFTLGVGHGKDPFKALIETLEEVLLAAPNTCYGFVYAEMSDDTHPTAIYFVNEYMPRLALALRKHGKAKLFFRYKNVFWALNNKLPLWEKLFLSKEYSDILIPASEDTNSRTQEYNLSGRVGMVAGGYVDNFAMRLVDDNPTSWRPLSPGGQVSISPYLRQGIIRAAYGANYGIIHNNAYTEEPGPSLLFALMKSGVLPIVSGEDILSIGSWHLIKDVDQEHAHDIDDGHSLIGFNAVDEEAVISVAQLRWAGTNVPDHDFSKISLGVEYRWLNFMPEMPNGMVPIGPIGASDQLDDDNIPYTVSDGKQGFSNGTAIPIEDYAVEMNTKVAEGKANLPITVEGASWSAIKIDEIHTRLILVDPAYVEPRERIVRVNFQGTTPTSGLDILSKENVSISESIEVIVPAGSVRFIDFTY